MKEEEKVAHDLISNVEKSSIFILVSKSESECDGRSSNCKTICLKCNSEKRKTQRIPGNKSLRLRKFRAKMWIMNF